MFFLAFLAACSDYHLAADLDPETPADTDDEVVDSPVVTEDTDVPEETEDTDVPVDEHDTGVPAATADAYANTASELYSFDSSKRTVKKIGDFENRHGTNCTWMTDIAINLAGEMYGICDDRIVRIDPTDAGFVKVVDLPSRLSAAVGLTFLPDGKLVVSQDRVETYDLATGTWTTLVDGGFDTSGDIIGLPDGYLYWTVTGGDALVRIDPSTGATTEVGSLGVTQVWGLGYADGELFGFESQGKLFTVDPGTGKATYVKDTRASGFYGATTNPVTW
jgi:hypothetical protein